MQKLDLLKQEFARQFSNEAKVGDNFVKIRRLEFYQEDLEFFYNLSQRENVTILIKRSGKGVTAIASIL